MLVAYLLDPGLLIAGVAITAILFAVIAFFTRAPLRRIVGALIAAAPLVLLIQFYDTIAAQSGWWNYPSVAVGSALLAWYVAAALGYGAALVVQLLMHWISGPSKSDGGVMVSANRGC